MNANGQRPQENGSRDLAPTLRTRDSSEGARGSGSGQTNAPAAVPVIPDHELLRRVGQGSYGEVWLARNVLGEYRAVKVVYRGTFQSARPFDREFEGIKKFEPISRSHESQVQILHVGRAPDDSGFYYIMELADDASAERGARNAESQTAESEQGGKPENVSTAGSPGQPTCSPATYVPKTLRSEIQRRGRLPPDECLEIALKLTQAVRHLHHHNLVHRDIKPSNIIFVHGIPKLADIGLVAKADATLSFVGTEGFLPPEGPGKPPADLYSLGKVLYEASTGRDRQDFPELPTDLRAVAARERLVEFNEIILKACEPAVARRYHSAEEMHADLVILQAGKSLKRLRTVERRFKAVTRAATVVTALAVVALAGFFYQRRQISIVATQRQRAESALTQVELVRVSETLERSDTSLALIQLAGTLRNAPTNRFVAERLMAAINEKNFLLPLARPLEHAGQINSACFSPDGRRIATASSDGTACIWRVSTGEVLNQPLQHASEVVSVQFSPDGHQIVTASKDGSVRVWDVETGQTAGAPLNHEGEASYAEFSPDRERILTVSGLAARVWDTRSRQLVGDVMRHSDQPVPIYPPVKSRWQGGNIEAAHFSPDGDCVATASRDGTARIWDARTGRPLTAPLHHNSRGVVTPAVTSVHFSSDSRRIVTASYDRTARIWDVRTGQPLAEPLKHQHPVNFACFSPDGGRVLTVSNDRTAQRKVPPDKLGRFVRGELDWVVVTIE